MDEAHQAGEVDQQLQPLELTQTGLQQGVNNGGVA
jgi:hypothetical protein